MTLTERAVALIPQPGPPAFALVLASVLALEHLRGAADHAPQRVLDQHRADAGRVLDPAGRDCRGPGYERHSERNHPEVVRKAALVLGRRQGQLAHGDDEEDGAAGNLEVALADSDGV